MYLEEVTREKYEECLEIQKKNWDGSINFVCPVEIVFSGGVDIEIDGFITLRVIAIIMYSVYKPLLLPSQTIYPLRKQKINIFTW